MIRSMTGYGRAACGPLEVEVRSVNHRYRDVQVRLPRALAPLEPGLRARVQARLRRGKVDLTVRWAEGANAGERVRVDVEAARRYCEEARRLHQELGVGGELDAATLLRLPGVARISECEPPLEELEPALTTALEQALQQLEAMRQREGTHLARELETRMGGVEARVTRLHELAERDRALLAERVRQRVEELAAAASADERARLNQELASTLERSDVTEELVRLRSHAEQFRRLLAREDEAVGRRLDFLLQEMGREANTLGAKAASAELSHEVVELRSELERLREQVQNVE